MDEELMHKRGRLPKHLVYEHVKQWMRMNNATEFEATRIAGLDERYFRRNKTIHWMVADRILTNLGISTAWFSDEELNYHYMRVNLCDETWANGGNTKATHCSHVGCNNKVDTRGFCSSSCKTAHHKRSYQMVKKRKEEAAGGKVGS